MITVFLTIIILLLYSFRKSIRMSRREMIKEKFTSEDKINELKRILRPVFDGKFYGRLRKLNYINIFDHINIEKGEKSYTINKRNVYLCLRDENNRFYENQQLIYVLLHEISHVVCDDVGHTDNFFAIFDDLLAICIREGVYDPSYILKDNYCLLGDETS